MNLKKSFTLLVALLMLASFAFAQTAEEVLAKYVKVSGGEAKLKAIVTSYEEGKLSIPAQGVEFDFKRMIKRPDKMKMEMVELNSGMMIVNCINGEKGWMINSFQGISEPVEMDEATYKMTAPQADPDGFMFKREARGIKLEYVGVEDRAGLKVHNIKVTSKEGVVSNSFFDTESGVLVGTLALTEQMGQKISTETRMSNYKKVNGILFAHTTVIITSGMEMTMTMTRYEPNSQLDDSHFAMRASKQ